MTDIDLLRILAGEMKGPWGELIRGMAGSIIADEKIEAYKRERMGTWLEDEEPKAYPPPMKGKVYAPDKTKLPEKVIIMPKLNGVRMRWDVAGQCLRTNNGNVVKSCDHIVDEIIRQKLNYIPLDGEAYNHSSEYSFSFLNGKSRKNKTTEETKFLQYHIFDVVDEKAKLDRLNGLVSYFNNLPYTQRYLFRVPFILEDVRNIQMHMRIALERRFEGIMIFDPATPYMHGRSNRVWKYKPFFDREDSFDGFEYTTEGRNKDTFASIRLKMEDGRTYTCSGISDGERKRLIENPPKIGAKITVEYGDLSDTGVPIFPRFKSVKFDE